jgi:hypothetical protein
VTGTKSWTPRLLIALLQVAVMAAVVVAVTSSGGKPASVRELLPSQPRGERVAPPPARKPAAAPAASAATPQTTLAVRGRTHGRRHRAGHVAAAPAAAPARPRPRLSRQEFIRRADTICSRTHAQLGDIGRRLGALVAAVVSKRLSRAGYYVRSAPLVRRSSALALGAVAELTTLPRPSDPRVGRYLALSGAQGRLLGAQAAALERRDAAAVSRLNGQLLAPEVQIRRLARAYGFHVCGGAGA